MKKHLIILVLLILVLHRCFFYFGVQPTSYEKIREHKDLNMYEISNLYIQYVEIELFGLILSPEYTKMAFCKQFDLPLTYDKIPKGWLKDHVVQDYILSLSPNQTKTICWKNYNEPRVALALWGTKVTCLKRDADSITIKWTIMTDFKEGKVEVLGIPVYEQFYHYFEQKGILSNPTCTIVETYNISDFKSKS